MISIQDNLSQGTTGQGFTTVRTNLFNDNSF